MRIIYANQIRLPHTSSPRIFSSSFRKIASSSRHWNVSLHFSAEFARPHFCAVLNHLFTSSSLTGMISTRHHFRLIKTERNWEQVTSTVILVSSCTSNPKWRPSSECFTENFAMILRWKNYILSICLTIFCTWVIPQGSGEKVKCDDLLLGQYPSLNCVIF